jgi:hypothetical protein
MFISIHLSCDPETKKKKWVSSPLLIQVHSQPFQTNFVFHYSLVLRDVKFLSTKLHFLCLKFCCFDGSSPLALNQEKSGEPSEGRHMGLFLDSHLGLSFFFLLQANNDEQKGERSVKEQMATVSTKVVSSVFDSYQKARTSFVQSVAELAQNPKNIDALQKGGVMALLRPLLLDSVPSIQHNAAQALGKLANYSPELAAAVVQADILPQLVHSLADQSVTKKHNFLHFFFFFPNGIRSCFACVLANLSGCLGGLQRFYRKAAAYVLKSVAKHSAELAQEVVKSGAVDALIPCLEGFFPDVKEMAAWAINYIARHTESTQWLVHFLSFFSNSSLQQSLLKLWLMLE